MPEVTARLPIVVAQGEGRVVTTAENLLTHPSLELKRVTRKVELQSARAESEEILLNGLIWKDVEYEAEGRHLGSDQYREPFSCCLAIPGVMPGDAVHLTDAAIEVETEEPVGPRPFRRFREKLDIVVRVTVTRLAQVTFTATAIKPELPTGPIVTLRPDP